MNADFKRGYDRIVWRPSPPVVRSCPVPAKRSDFPTPMFISDNCDSLQSMADGKVYDSKSALRRSYTAEGNPQGRDYTEIGATPLEPAGRATVDAKGIRNAIEKSLHDVKAGNVPDHIRAIK